MEIAMRPVRHIRSAHQTTSLKNETTELQTSRSHTILDAITALAASIAAAVSVIALTTSLSTTRQANDLSAAALDLAQTTAEEGVARRVYIGELPIDIAPAEANPPRSIVNANGVAVYDVTIEGVLDSEPAVINI